MQGHEAYYKALRSGMSIGNPFTGYQALDWDLGFHDAMIEHAEHRAYGYCE